MNEEKKKAIERIEKKILTEECKKVIRVPIYISDLKTVLNLIQKQQAELKKKDKIIDLMSESIFDYEHITYVDNEQFKKCKLKIIKKFEKKVEGDEYEK